MSDAAAANARQRRWAWITGLAAITLLGGVLRLIALGRVPDNPFYDAAVRSMTHSLHNFFFGAFEPGGSASIDKPPLDLWLQVVFVKLFGFSSKVLKLPSALAATAAVPLLYDVVRRLASRRAALASAAVLAVLPVAVVTARSDTMDSLMMALLVAVAWLLVRAVERRELRWLIAAALVLGVDFNVKLFEALIAAPAFLLFVWLCWRGEPITARLRQLALAGAAFTAIALSWLFAVSLTPHHDRPWPIGSTNGSAWNSVFVYNGSDRITKPPHPSRFDAVPTALVADARPVPKLLAAAAPRRKHKARPPSAPAGPRRLFKRSLVDFGGLIGTVLFAALVFGALGLAPFARRMLALPQDAERGAVVARAATVALGVWLLSGAILFSFAGRVHPRYLEAFTPAVAATLGVSLSVLARRARDARGVALLLGALAISVLEASSVTGHGKLVRGGLTVGIVIGAATALLLLVALWRARGGRWPAWCGATLVTLGALASLLAFPFARDMRLIRDHSGVQAAAPRVKPALVNALSRFLRAHQGKARYEFAVSAPSLAAPLVVRDVRPILLLTTVDARPLLTLPQLRQKIAAGEVSYVLTRGHCPHPPYRLLPACSAAVKWVVTHGKDVTALLHTGERGLLYRVSAASPGR